MIISVANNINGIKRMHLEGVNMSNSYFNLDINLFL